jgi:hypothetical protein
MILAPNNQKNDIAKTVGARCVPSTISAALEGCDRFPMFYQTPRNGEQP